VCSAPTRLWIRTDTLALWHPYSLRRRQEGTPKGLPSSQSSAPHHAMPLRRRPNRSCDARSDHPSDRATTRVLTRRLTAPFSTRNPTLLGPCRSGKRVCVTVSEGFRRTRESRIIHPRKSDAAAARGYARTAAGSPCLAHNCHGESILDYAGKITQARQIHEGSDDLIRLSMRELFTISERAKLDHGWGAWRHEAVFDVRSGVC